MQKVKLFIGFTFDQTSQLSRKLDGFRSRFDPDFHKNKLSHMSLFAPFMIDSTDVDELVFDLEDELENFFYGHQYRPSLDLVGIDVFNNKKKNLLNFRPILDDDFLHLQESLHDLCQSYIHEKENKTKVGKSFLVVGRFQDELGLADGIETLKREFDTPFKLPLRSISVFTRYNGEWREAVKLLDFEEENQREKKIEVILNG